MHTFNAPQPFQQLLTIVKSTGRLRERVRKAILRFAKRTRFFCTLCMCRDSVPWTGT